MSKLLTSRTRAQADWTCNRKRWWNYNYNGHGVVPEATAVELYIGTALHDGLAAIAHQHQAYSKRPESIELCCPINLLQERVLSQTHGVDIDLIASTAFKQVSEALLGNDKSWEGMKFAYEQAALTEGLLRGYFRAVWPKLISEYPKIVAIEKEIIYEHDDKGKPNPNGGFDFVCIPDLVLANDNGNVYIEYKSTSSKKDQWINAWNNAIQVHATAWAIQQTSGTKIQHTIVQGLYKGYEAYGKLSSPMCYAYHKAGNPPFVKEEFSYEYKAGFKKVPTWELDGGVKRWVENMPDDVLAEQFPQTPPIFIDEALVERYFSQRAKREKTVNAHVLYLEGADEAETVEVMDEIFPQNFDACNPGWGRPCQYRQLCFGGKCDPLKRGFRLRDERHSREKVDGI